MTTLERLAELEAAATPGPWYVSRSGTSSTTVATDADGGFDIIDVFNQDAPIAKATASYIAALRNAAPKLLAVVEAARALCDLDDQWDALSGLSDDEGTWRTLSARQAKAWAALRAALEALDE